MHSCTFTETIGRTPTSAHDDPAGGIVARCKALLTSSRAATLIAVAAAVVGFAASAAPAASAASIPFGFNDNGVAQGLVTPAQDALLAKEGGATVERITVDWQWAEPEPGVYDLAPYDAIYDALIAQGIKPLWVPIFAPSWAISSSTPCNQDTQDCRYPPAPAHDEDYAGLAAYFATRYPDSAGIEVWNEENLDYYWEPAPNAAAYEQLLQTTYTMVKKYAPNMPVVLGGVSDLESSDPNDVPLGTFLQQVYADGGQNYMNAVSVHPYPAQGTSLAQTWQAMATVRQVQAEYNDLSRPVWVTEVGVSTNGGAVTPQQQASMLGQIYTTLESPAYSYVQMLMIHTLVDPEDTDVTDEGYGVVSDSLAPSPAFCTLAALQGSSFSCPQ